MKYFAYGMNTNLAEMASRCPGAVNLGPAQIEGYEFVFRTHADIAAKKGAVCQGVLWEIDDDNLDALDMLEGYPTYYTRFSVAVTTTEGTATTLIYQMNNQQSIKMPYISYLDMVTEGYQENNISCDQLEQALLQIDLAYD
jgi:gamma-glutamylcyclotransferase (GGCT)/AIG2-like uncharacterized protein YtfP